jgi:ABC-2 type transport system permease protein
MKTIVSLYIGNVREFFRNGLALFFTLAFPLLFIFLFGLLFGGNFASSYNIGVVDQDQSGVSQAFVAIFQSPDIKKVLNPTAMNDLDKAKDKLKKGDLDMILVIPSGLAQNVQSKQTTSIQLILDPTRSAADTQIKLSIIQNIIAGFNQGFTKAVPALAFEQVAIQTSPLRAIDILVPGILAMALMQLGLFATSTPLVALRSQQVLRRLGATPLPRWQMQFGEILFRLTIAIVQTGLIIGVGIWVFHVHVQGNIFELLGFVILGASSFIGLGYLIAAISKTVEAATGISQTLNFPMLFLSGIFFPAPTSLKIITDLIPVSYLADGLRQIMVNSTPAYSLSTDILVLAGWTVVTGILSARFFRWE